jgi:hypothetical protein
MGRLHGRIEALPAHAPNLCGSVLRECRGSDPSRDREGAVKVPASG